MERLTDKIGNTNCVKGCGSNCKYGFQYCCKEDWENCQTISDVIDKLAYYEDLEENGRLVKLPCKLGDTVYVPTRDFISELRIIHITISKNNTFFHWMLNAGIYPNLDGFSVDKIGKTVFFTKSEAEAKLKELRCNND